MNTSPDSAALFAAAASLGADCRQDAAWFKNATQVEIGGLALNNIVWSPAADYYTMEFARPDNPRDDLRFDSKRSFIVNRMIGSPVVRATWPLPEFRWRVYLALPGKGANSEISVPSAICNDLRSARDVYVFDISSPARPKPVNLAQLKGCRAPAGAKQACVETVKKARAFAAAADPDAFPFAYVPAIRELVMWLRGLPPVL